MAAGRNQPPKQAENAEVALAVPLLYRRTEVTVTYRPNLLLVAPSPLVATVMSRWLTRSGCDVTLATSFAEAKALLEEQRPSVLISEVRLAEYNGLHLAMRALENNIPAFVLGEADPVLQQEAAALGAVYLAGQIDRNQLVEMIHMLTSPAHILAAASTPRLASELVH